LSERTKLSLKELISEPFDLELPDGTWIEVPQPALEDMLYMSKFLTEMKEAESKDDAVEQLQAFQSLKDILETVIPQLKEFKLNFDQTLQTYMTLQEEAIPKKMQFLEEKGINLKSQEKKEASATPNS